MRNLKSRNQSQSQKNNRDHFQKPATNLDMIEDLQRAVSQLYRIIGEVNSRVIAVSQAKVEAKTLAKFLLDQSAQEEYMKKLNEEMDLLIAEKNKTKETIEKLKI